MNANEFPVAIIGGGPVGLAAATHLVARGLPVHLYEAGAEVGAHVRGWGHVRLFSPWRYNMDPTAVRYLHQRGWQEPPADNLPTGQELVDAYLAPLAEALNGAIETGARVTSVARSGVGKMTTQGRAAHPFSLAIDGKKGKRIEFARAVIDASGTWGQPNPIGASGLPLPGEAALADRIAYGIPDILRAERSRYAGKRVLVLGGGHSAANVLLDLSRLQVAHPESVITWVVRGKDTRRLFGGGAADQLAARGQLGSDLRQLVQDKRVQLIAGFAAEAIESTDDGLVVTGRHDGQRMDLPAVDRLVVATGQRPDLAMTRELRLDLDPWIESSRALGPLIDPNLHSCGSVPPHGYKELTHPEPDYFAVGIKSYGRAPTFLMATGYEQVRSISAYLAGDLASADDVRLVLPETGVCSTDLAAAQSDLGCCGGPAPEDSSACCSDDATAKAAGKKGCGCNDNQVALPASAKFSCCGPRAAHG